MHPCHAVRFFKTKSEVKKNYDLGDQLGTGNFAVVKKAKYKGAPASPPRRAVPAQ